MAAYQDCIDNIVKAAGGTLKEDDVEDLLLALHRRVTNNVKKSGLNPDQALAKEASRLGREVDELLKIHKANTLWNTVKSDQVRQRMRAAEQAGSTKTNGMFSILTGMNKEYFGNRLSVESVMGSYEKKYAAGFVAELQREGLDKIWASKVHSNDIFNELWELDMGARGNPGKMQNPDALRVAQVIHKYQKLGMADLNREGAYRRSYMGHIAKTVHDANKIRGTGWKPTIGKAARTRQENAAQKQWVNFTLGHIDIDRMFDGDVDHARKMLNNEWSDFSKGKHERLGDVNGFETQGRGMNLAKLSSQSRVFHWKSADSFLAYQKQYGAGDVRSTIMTSFRENARTVALMQFFGTNPQAAFDAHMNWIAGPEGSTPSQYWNEHHNQKRMLEIRMRMLTGEANQVKNKHVDFATRWLMAVQGLAKLGSASITSISDVVTGANRIGRQTNQAKAMMQYVKGPVAYFRGRGSVGSERRLEADSILVGMDSLIGRMYSGFETLDSDMRGLTAKLQGIFHKYTLLSPMTDRARMDVQLTLAHHYGKALGDSFGDLPLSHRRTMESYGIGEAEWEALRHGTPANPANRGKMLEPSLAYSAPDAQIATILGDLAPTADNISRAREDLAMRVSAWLHDSGTSGVLETSVRSRSILTQGTNPGTPEGMAIRLLTQFKAFPTELITRLWGEALFSGRGPQAAMASVFHLLVGTTAYGFAALVMADLTRGRNPRPWNEETFFAALAKGGGLSILGDLALSDAEKYGHEWYDPLIGPGAEFALDIGDTASSLMRGDMEKAGQKAQQLVSKNLPGANVWYTKWLVDYAFLRAWQEALNPGVLARKEARDRREGITYWLPPTERAF